MKIAVYSANFGNYREELKNSLDNFTYDKDIDYYFFTDNDSLNAKHWNIIHCPLMKDDAIMDGARWTAKHIKFVTHDFLKHYDILVWCDSKLLNKSFQSIFDQSPRESPPLYKTEILKLFEGNSYKMFNFLHPHRYSPQEELVKTIEYQMENVNNAHLFLDEIKDRRFSTPLTDTCCIIRKNDTKTNNLFEYIFTLMQIKGLKRDQNIYAFAIDELKYNPSWIGYLQYDSMFDTSFRHVSKIC